MAHLFECGNLENERADGHLKVLISVLIDVQGKIHRVGLHSNQLETVWLLPQAITMLYCPSDITNHLLLPLSDKSRVVAMALS